jgi:hypothetical protein
VDTALEKQSSLNNRNDKTRTNRRMEGQNARDTYASADELSESFGAADVQGTRELRENESRKLKELNEEVRMLQQMLKDRDENPSLSNHKPPTAHTPPRNPREYRGEDGNRERYANFDQSSREPSQHHETGWYTPNAEERVHANRQYNEATKDWTIVDIPPGAGRVRMNAASTGRPEPVIYPPSMNPNDWNTNHSYRPKYYHDDVEDQTHSDSYRTQTQRSTCPIPPSSNAENTQQEYHFKHSEPQTGFTFSTPGSIFAEFMRGSGAPDPNENVFPQPNSDARPSRKMPEPPEVTVVERPLPLTLEEICRGTKKKMKLKSRIFDELTGKRATDEKILEMYVKPGMKGGSKFKFKGVGDQEEGGQQDLHFILEEVSTIIPAIEDIKLTHPFRNPIRCSPEMGMISIIR